MHTLKTMINRYIQKVTFILVIVILAIITVLQLINEQIRARESAARIFSQTEQLLAENQKELTEVEAEYKQTCRYNAETIARIIESDPDVLNSIDELKEILSAEK